MTDKQKTICSPNTHLRPFFSAHVMLKVQSLFSKHFFLCLVFNIAEKNRNVNLLPRYYCLSDFDIITSPRMTS